MKKKKYMQPLTEEIGVKPLTLLASSENIYRDKPEEDENPDKEYWPIKDTPDSKGDYWIAE